MASALALDREGLTAELLHVGAARLGDTQPQAQHEGDEDVNVRALLARGLDERSHGLGVDVERLAPVPVHPGDDRVPRRVGGDGPVLMDHLVELTDRRHASGDRGGAVPALLLPPGEPVDVGTVGVEGVDSGLLAVLQVEGEVLTVRPRSVLAVADEEPLDETIDRGHVVPPFPWYA